MCLWLCGVSLPHLYRTFNGGAASEDLSEVAQDKALKLAFQNLGKENLGQATVNTAASTVGDIKIGIDFLTFGYTAFQCKFGFAN